MASSAKLMRSCSESNLTRNNVSSSKKDLGIAKSSSLSELQQRPSHLRASPSYSFGAPRHGTGKFKVPCPLAHSRASYVETLHSVACNIPGPGSYDRATCIGLGGSQMDKVAPRFSFGNSRLPRFYHQTRRHSLLYHCQAYPTGQDTSAEGPGVGHYFGGDKHLPVQCKTSPVYSLGDRRVNYHMNCKGYWWRPTPGANAYKVEDKRYCEDFNNLVKSPSFTIGKEKGREKGEALINSTATNADVGPGKYSQATSLIATSGGKSY